MSVAIDSSITFAEPVTEFHPMPRISIPTPDGPLVLTFIEQVPGTDVWKVEGQRNGRGVCKHLYVRVLPGPSVEELRRRAERKRQRAILAAKGWPN